MKIKEWLIWVMAGLFGLVTVVVVVSIILSGFSKDQGKFIQYYESDMKIVFELDKLVSGEYESVAGDNFKDDETMYNKLVSYVIPDSLKLIGVAENVSSELDEIKGAHILYLQAIRTQHNGFEMLKDALVNKDTTMVKSANSKFELAQAQFNQYRKMIEEIGEKFNITFE